MPDPAPGTLHLAARSASREAKLAALSARRTLYQREAAPLARQMREAAADGRGADVLRLAGALGDEIKALHVAAFLCGRGGRWGEMTSADWGRIQSAVFRQYDYLLRWAAQLAATAPDALPSAAQVEARAMLYAAAATASFEAGMCADVGLDDALLPALPGDGTTECRVNCRCRWAIRVLSKARGDYDVTWRLGAAEHCRTCRTRARVWLRLRIRAGRWADGPPEPVAAP